MIGGRAVTGNGVQRRPQHLLVLLEPLLAEVADGNGFKAQDGRGADFELAIDLCGQLPGGFLVGADARSMALTMLVVAQIPDPAPEVGKHLANAERFGLGHVILRESSRHKTPQTPPQTGSSEELSERQKPMCQALVTHRPTGKRRGRDSNPRWSKPHTGFRDRPIRPLWHLSGRR